MQSPEEDRPTQATAWRPLLLAAIAIAIGSAMAGRALLAEPGRVLASVEPPATMPGDSLGSAKQGGSTARSYGRDVGPAKHDEVATGALPAGAVAVVDGRAVTAASYERLLAALAADRSEPLDEEDRRYVLDRMIDEELLLGRALALELPRRDRRIRGMLVQSVMASILAGQDIPDPSRDELRAYFDAHRDAFVGTERVRVRHIHISAEPERTESEAAERARSATKRLRNGEAFASVSEALGDAALIAVPDALLPPNKLREYLGPTATRTAFALEVGEVSDPVRSATGYEVVVVVERAAPEPLTFEQAEGVVRAEWRRTQEEQALRRYLDGLRREARIVVADDLSK